MPIRIQRKRTKGWRAPMGSVYVGRPTCYGNPFKVGDVDPLSKKVITPVMSVKLYRAYASDMPPKAVGWWFNRLRELRGKDLMCWCRIDQPCHADVLLELANG